MKFQWLGRLSHATLFVWLAGVSDKESATRGTRVYVLSNGQDGLDDNVHNHHTLGAKVEGQDLEGVRDQQTGEPNVVKDSKDPDEDELGVPGTLVGAARVLVDGAGDGPADKRGDHAADGDQEEGTATKVVDCQSSTDGARQIENGLSGGDGELLVLLRNAGAFVDGVHVVGEECVTRVLRDDAERDDDGKTPAVTLGPEEVEVAGRLGGVLLHQDGLLDLAVLELDGGVVVVAAGVVLGQDGQCLFGPVLVDEESGGLGDEPDTDELNDRGDDLDEGDGAPAPVVVDVGSTPADTGDNQGSQVPQTVVDGGDGTTVLGMADLGKQEGRGHLSEGVAETENESAANIHCDGQLLIPSPFRHRITYFPSHCKRQ